MESSIEGLEVDLLDPKISQKHLSSSLEIVQMPLELMLWKLLMVVILWKVFQIFQEDVKEEFVL